MKKKHCEDCRGQIRPLNDALTWTDFLGRRWSRQKRDLDELIFECGTPYYVVPGTRIPLTASLRRGNTYEVHGTSWRYRKLSALRKSQLVRKGAYFQKTGLRRLLKHTQVLR